MLSFPTYNESEPLTMRRNAMTHSDTYRVFDPWRPSPLVEKSREQIVSTHYFNVDRLELRGAGSVSLERYVLHENHGDTIGVLATTEDGSIPLVEQYRIPTHRWTLEIPGGHAIAPDERPLHVARRKLREEAGFEASEFTQFGRFINTPSFSTQYTALFYATGLTAVERGSLGPETPRSDVRLVSQDDAYDMVLNGTIVDAKTVIAILRLHTGLHLPE